MLNGLRLIRLVADGVQSPARLQEETGLPRSTVHRLIQALRSEGYLRDTRDGLGLGSTLIELGFNALASNSLASVARPHLETLAEDVRDTVHFAVRDHEAVLYLVKIPGRRGAEMRSRVGLRMPLTRTGIGKALLLDEAAQWQELWRAEVPADESTDSPLEHGSSKQVEKDFLVRMGRYRKDGFAYDLEENEPGIRCVAAPVRDGSGRIVGAVSVSATAPYMATERMRALVPEVKSVARTISGELGHRSSP